MPRYDYKCKVCGNIEEINHSVEDINIKYNCKVCGEIYKRLISREIGIKFVGAGFYTNDKNN